MKAIKDDFPDVKREWWFVKLPEQLKKMAFSWEERDGKIYVLTHTLKSIPLEPYLEEMVKKDVK